MHHLVNFGFDGCVLGAGLIAVFFVAFGYGFAAEGTSSWVVFWHLYLFWLLGRGTSSVFTWACSIGVVLVQCVVGA